MKLPRHGWFQTKASNLVDLNQLGWLAMDLFEKKILDGTSNLGWFYGALTQRTLKKRHKCQFAKNLKRRVHEQRRYMGTHLHKTWK
jgi:hypothetical protein